MALSEEQLSISEERQNKVLAEIKKIQEVEQKLFEHLQTRASRGADKTELDKIIEKMDKLTSTRNSLFSGLTDNYSQVQDNVAATRNHLVDQMTTSNMADAEVKSAQKDLAAINGVKNNHQRMTEINTYYAKRYEAHTYTMKLIIYAAVPILLFSILSKKNILPPNLATALSSLVIVIVGLLMFLHLMDIGSRNNMVYNEYDFGGAPSKKDMDDSSGSSYESEGEVCENEFEVDENGDIPSDKEDTTNGSPVQQRPDGQRHPNPTVEEFSNRNSVLRESFQNSRIPLNVAYVASPTPSCPWGKSSSVVKPFAASENYATV